MRHVADTLNQRVDCPECGSRAPWESAGRANSRENATLYRFRCSCCQEQIFAKVRHLSSEPDPDNRELEMEHRALLAMEAIFPAHGSYGALTPIDYIRFDGCEVLVTRRFAGDDLHRCARRTSASELPKMFLSAGVLLRKLHDASPDATSFRSLDAERKLRHLSQSYGEQLLATPIMFDAFMQLRGDASRIARTKVAWAWAHGDFKPENVLYDGRKIVVFDTKLSTRGACVYDIASFLNHVRLSGRTLGGCKVARHYRQIEAEFLAGYGVMNSAQIAVLRWAQLYFMLCYYGRYARRGKVAELYARYLIGPLVQDLAKKLARA
jgi:aminoglycoside phosphotransferase (APT) family kinase protein